MDLITAIDGEPVNDGFREKLGKKPQTVLTVKRTGNRMEDIPLTGIPVLSENFVPESWYARCDVSSMKGVYVTQKTLNIEPIEIMSDPEADLYGYATFDFEFAGNNILQQKEIAVALETILTKKGLARDRDNPDLLIFIEFYSDKREQYVPPSQQLKTRYGIGFNWFSGKFETRPRIESHETGDYTRVDYLSKLSIAMADAHKMQAGDNDFTVWQANYEAVFNEKAKHKEFGEKIGSAMLSGFPYKYVAIVRYCHYWFTGILYDSEIPGKVVGVIPDSPADRAGIKAGNVIKKCSAGNNQIFKKSYSSLLEKADKKMFYHFNYERFALTRTSEFQLEMGADYRGYPLHNIYMSYQIIAGFVGDKRELTNYDKNPPVFTVQYGGGKKTGKVTVTPVYRVYAEYILQE
jgi:hypothetical protein